ncbi:sodium:solute symporter family transporter [Streptomyces millisiae]|uniref:Sodium:solute symporter n=1 Tax=Streptomyces millisiae TaxID=3075542 RepID=A0ABU2LTE3_9ACTN|nr:sodium:solute symporter [Streptomyces sp. DSM 44918]MDT0320857.1 sodium:solute symporter [Streptomyces sp. DSM 44918]
MADKLVILLYLLVMVVAGYVGMRRSRTSEDFAIAGRRLGPFMYTSAMSTVVLGAASTVGGVSLGYQYGVSGMVLVLALALGIAAIGVCFAGKLFRSGVFTVPDALGRRFGARSRVLSSAVVVFYTLMVGVGQIIAIGTVLTVVFDVSATTAAFIGWATIMLYSVAGGMWSITLTDVVQFLVKTVGILCLMLPLALREAGGLGRMREALPDGFFSPTGIGVGTIWAYFLLFFFGFMIDQGNWQRLLTARSERVARWGAVASGAYCALYGLAGALIGTAARVSLPELANPDDAYARVAALVLPVGLFGVVIAAALAASMSTASGLLIGASTVLTNDVLRPLGGARRGGVRADRVALFAVGLVALGLSFALDSVVGAVTVAADVLAAALLIPVVGAMFWKRSTTAGALAGMLAGTVVCVVMMVRAGLYANEPVSWGMVACLVVFVAVSLVTRPDPRTGPLDFEELPALAEAADPAAPRVPAQAPAGDDDGAPVSSPRRA